MVRLVWILGLVLGFGVCKVRWEHGLLGREKEQGLQGAFLDLGLRSQVGQMGFVAALSGFRAVIADLTWVRAYTAFEQTEWGRLKLLLEAATQLQPRAILFWEMAHYHMAYDAATYARDDEGHQPSQYLRRKAEREYQRIGEQFLLSGIAYNPESARLYELLGTFYARKMDDPLKAFEAYAMASQKPGARAYVRGFAGYELAKVVGREREAYDWLREVWNEHGRRGRSAPPTLRRVLRELEHKLRVPEEQRVSFPALVPEK